MLDADWIGSVLLEALHPAVTTYVRARPLARYAVACSGGADSVALVCAVLRLVGADRLSILHYNHATRGADSDADEAYVRQLAAMLGVRYYTQERPPGQPVSEAALRKDRYGFLHACVQAQGLEGLFLGHHRDDVVETVLMRLCRGSSLSGVCAPRAVQVMNQAACVHLRPLLNVPKADLVAALRQGNCLWREDASNAENMCVRNRMRSSVLPALEACMPGYPVRALIARSRELLEEDDAALNAWVQAVVPESAYGECLETRYFEGKPRGFVRRVVYQWLTYNSVLDLLNARAVDGLISSLIAGEPTSLSVGERWIEVSRHQAIFRQQAVAIEWEPMQLCEDTRIYLPRGGCIECRQMPLTLELRSEILGKLYSPRCHAFLDTQAIVLPLCVRNWLPGDAYRPLNAPGERKLQDLFTDKKIPKADRLDVPVVVDASGAIVWVQGFAPVHTGQINVATQHVYHLEWHA